MSKSPVFSGIVPPVATPLLPDGGIDYESLAQLVEHLIAQGVHGLFSLGSTGETAYLTDAQRLLIVEATIKVANGRVPVIAGAIEISSSRISELAQKLADVGVDAVVTTAPLYTLNSESEIAKHFRDISKELSVPLWAYDIPLRVKTKLSQGLLVSLGQEGVIEGVKDSSGDDVGFRRLIAANNAAGHPLQLLTGHEVLVDVMGFAGADGAVPGLANVEASGYVRVWEAVTNQDWELARTEQERINKIFEIVFQPKGLSGDATGAGAFKAAMKELGIIKHSNMSLNLERISENDVKAIRAILSDLGLLGNNS